MIRIGKLAGGLGGVLLASLLFARPANPLSVGADAAIHVYQKLISPLQGHNVCNFSPSCSAFSRGSYRLYGPVWGTLMTFDRLERCNPGAWRHLNQYYDDVYQNKLTDPPRNHHLPTRLKERRRKREEINSKDANGD
jgi:putative component of membrane protein insertase Oxa1/YidC/SpoIIIJ protein YidD